MNDLASLQVLLGVICFFINRNLMKRMVLIKTFPNVSTNKNCK